MNKILFWDFDGTLSEPNRSFFTALPEAMGALGYAADQAETTEFLIGAYSWRSPHISYTDSTKELWWDTFFGKIRDFCTEKNIAGEDANKICTRFREILCDVSNYTLYDDTAATLEKCCSLGFKNYLITNNYPEITDNIKKLGLWEFFTDYIVSTHIGYEKPRREFFETARKIAGCTDGGYVIGDNPIKDIKGGKDAGFITVAVRACKNSCADYYLEKISDIFSVISDKI